MRRSPFYVPSSSSRYDNPSEVHPCTFRSFPAQSDPPYFRHSRPHGPQAFPSTPRSIINIPVQGSTSSPGPSISRRLPSHRLLDPHQAATRIQSCYRGFAVRRHCPIFHLRSIFAIRKELQLFKAELENPGFTSKIRGNNKERLRFSETVMALILRLDAVEGSLPEVRSHRKELTKMAIGLQDSIEAIIMQHEEVSCTTKDEASSDGARIKQEEAVLGCEQPSQQARSTVTEEPTLLDNGVAEVPPLLDDRKSLGGICQTEVHDTAKDLHGISRATNFVSDTTDQVGRGQAKTSLYVIHNGQTSLNKGRNESNEETHMESPDVSDQIVLSASEEHASSDCANCRMHGENSVDATSDVYIQDVASAAGMWNCSAEIIPSPDHMEGTSVGKCGGEGEMVDHFTDQCAQAEESESPFDRHAVTDVDTSPKGNEGSRPLKDAMVYEVRESPEALDTIFNRDEMSDDVPFPKPNIDNGLLKDITIVDEMRETPSVPPGALDTTSNGDVTNESSKMLPAPVTQTCDHALCPLSCPSVPTSCSRVEGLLTEGMPLESSSLQQRSDMHGTENFEALSTECECKPQASEPTEAEPSVPDKVLLQQLSEDCKQMKSLLNKLLLQSKAQSKVICALGDRLEVLEQRQQHCSNQHVHRKGRKRSKSKKAE